MSLRLILVDESCSNPTGLLWIIRNILFTFLRVEGIEPTNNAAERDRPAVQWRKICFGNQSCGGERFTERILTRYQNLPDATANPWCA
jgi:hypothetical protein